VQGMLDGIGKLDDKGFTISLLGVSSVRMPTFSVSSFLNLGLPIYAQPARR
jgi:hypothetical protein